MAKATTSKTESLTIRVPVELLAAWRDAAQKGGVSVGAMVIDLARRGAGLTTSTARLSPTTLAMLRSDPAMKAIDPNVHHVSGPIMADPVPRTVVGDVEWCGLKGQDKEKSKKA